MPLMALGVRYAYINDRTHAIGRTGTSSTVRAIDMANRRDTMVCRCHLKLGPSVGEGLNRSAPPSGGAVSVPAPSPPVSLATRRPAPGRA